MSETKTPMVDRVALVLEAAGHAPVTAVNFDQVVTGGYRVRASRSNAVYVYADLAPVTRQQQNTLKNASSSEAWRTAADEIDAGRQARREELLQGYATALRAAGFTVDLIDLDSIRARLRAIPAANGV